MKVLSIDTSSDICGVSILDDNNLICKLDSNTRKNSFRKFNAND